VFEIEKLVKNMVAKGLDDEFISSITGLTPKEVRRLKN